MNPYDRSTAFGKRRKITWSSLKEFYKFSFCYKSPLLIVIFLFPVQQLVPMDCAARAGSLKSGMAVAPQKASPKVCSAHKYFQIASDFSTTYTYIQLNRSLLFFFVTVPCPCLFLSVSREVLLRGHLPRPGSVSHWLVYQSGSSRLGYALPLFTNSVQQNRQQLR